MIPEQNKLAFALHQKLVQTCIDFAKENSIFNIDCVSFQVDNLQESVANNEWMPATDSSCQIYKYNLEKDDIELISASY